MKRMTKWKIEKILIGQCCLYDNEHHIVYVNGERKELDTQSLVELLKENNSPVEVCRKSCYHIGK